MTVTAGPDQGRPQLRPVALPARLALHTIGSSCKNLQLKLGDGIVLYTDGFTEAENPTGEQYGLERLCKIISRNWTKPAEAIIDAVVFDVRDFIDVQTIYDDLTLLVVKQK